MPSADPAPIPLSLLYEDEAAAWTGAQRPVWRQWLSEQPFRGERGRVILLPDESGAIGAAVAGLGKRRDGVTLWHAAGIAERLPVRRFRLQQAFTAAESTQLCLGFA